MRRVDGARVRVCGAAGIGQQQWLAGLGFAFDVRAVAGRWENQSWRVLGWSVQRTAFKLPLVGYDASRWLVPYSR